MPENPSHRLMPSPTPCPVLPTTPLSFPGPSPAPCPVEFCLRMVVIGLLTSLLPKLFLEMVNFCLQLSLLYQSLLPLLVQFFLKLLSLCQLFRIAPKFAKVEHALLM